MNNYFTNTKAPTLATTYSTSISSNTVVTLNTGTTYIEVTATTKGIFLKWNGTASTSSFDEFIGVGLTRTYEVPIGSATANFIEQAASGVLVCIEK